MNKNIKRSVDFLINGGSATTGFPIGATLLLYGMKADDFVNKFNEITKGWENFIFSVRIIIYYNGDFDLIIKSPKVWELLGYFAEENLEGIKITKTNIYNICKLKTLNQSPLVLKNMYKNILSLLVQHEFFIKNE